MSNSAVQSMVTIDRFLQEVGGTVKAAEANTEPGSIGGETQHPVKDVDDSTEDAKEGDRSAENTADVKADQGNPSVENTKENVTKKKAIDGKSEDGTVNPPGTASEDQLQIGTKKEPTGQDPSVETSSAKGGKEDPASAGEGQVGKSTHPARTDNQELDGYKYAEMDTDKLAKVASDLGNQLLSSLADLEKGAEGQPAASQGNQSQASQKQAGDASQAADVAGQAGWELAGLLSGNFDKKAADQLVHQTLVEIIDTASQDAEKVAHFLETFNQESQAAQSQPTTKRANTQSRPATKKANAEMAAGVDPAAMMGAGGGAPPADPAMGAGPEAGPEAGGMEAGPEAGDMELEQLAALLEQLGITPEVLEAAMAQGGGGVAPEAAPAAEGPAAGGEVLPPEEAPEGTAGDTPGMEVEASDKGKEKAAAQKGAAEQTTRNLLQEILERSRS